MKTGEKVLTFYIQISKAKIKDGFKKGPVPGSQKVYKLFILKKYNFYILHVRFKGLVYVYQSYIL